MTSNQIAIRLMTEHDAELVVEFYTALSDETWRFYCPHPRDQAYLENMVHALPDRPDLAYFMAISQKDGANFMVGTVIFWDWTKLVPWFGICSRDGWQGQGLGDQMMAFAVEYAHQHGKGGILLTTHKENLRAQALYKKYAFETIGVDERNEYLMILRFPDTK